MKPIDEFAKAAMAALMHNPYNYSILRDRKEELAKASFDIAESMEAERLRREKLDNEGKIA